MPEHRFDMVFARRADGGPPRFVQMLERAAHERGLIFVRCETDDQAELIRRAIAAGELAVGMLVDYMGRSFRHDAELGRAVRDSGGLTVVDPDLVRRFGDKAAAHRALAAAGLELPRTLVWPAGAPPRDLTPAERAYLGPRIVCKPSHGSGAYGVSLDTPPTAEGLAGALAADPDDDFLLQEFVEPLPLGGEPAWFRVYNCFGRVFACWWHPETHATRAVTHEEAARHGLAELEHISRTIEAATGYTWFSTEVALADRGGRRAALPVDYLNNKCYMLTHGEVGERGLPDALAEAVARELADQALRIAQRPARPSATSERNS